MNGLRFWQVCLVFIAIAALGLFTTRDRLLPWVVRWLDVGEEPQRTEYVMVLGGDRFIRPQVAASLVKCGFARTVLLPTPISAANPNSRLRTTADGSIRSVLIQCGVAEHSILTLDKKVANTYDEAIALAGFLRSQPQGRVSVVTSDFHTRRAQWVFRQILGNDSSRVIFVSSPTRGLDANNWWQSNESVYTVRLEYCKLVYYLLRYSPLGFYLFSSGALLATIATCRYLLSRAKYRPEMVKKVLGNTSSLTSADRSAELSPEEREHEREKRAA